MWSMYLVQRNTRFKNPATAFAENVCWQLFHSQPSSGHSQRNNARSRRIVCRVHCQPQSHRHALLWRVTRRRRTSPVVRRKIRTSEARSRSHLRRRTAFFFLAAAPTDISETCNHRISICLDSRGSWSPHLLRACLSLAFRSTDGNSAPCNACFMFFLLLGQHFPLLVPEDILSLENLVITILNTKCTRGFYYSLIKNSVFQIQRVHEAHVTRQPLQRQCFHQLTFAVERCPTLHICSPRGKQRMTSPCTLREDKKSVRHSYNRRLLQLTPFCMATRLQGKGIVYKKHAKLRVCGQHRCCQRNATKDCAT